jgi:hypothetical protein
VTPPQSRTRKGRPSVRPAVCATSGAVPTIISLMRRVVITGMVAAALAFVSLPLSAHAATTKATDTAIVNAGLLTINDFPPGWTESPRASSSGDTNLNGYGKTCMALQKTADAAKKLRTASGKSPNFKQGSFDQVSNDTSTYRTAAGAKAALSVFKRSEIGSCLEKFFRDQVNKQAQSGITYTASIGRLSVPQAGDDTVGYEIAITVSGKGLTLHLNLDLQLVLVGRAGLTFQFEGQGTSPMIANQPLVQMVVSRVRAAQVHRGSP